MILTTLLIAGCQCGSDLPNRLSAKENPYTLELKLTGFVYRYWDTPEIAKARDLPQEAIVRVLVDGRLAKEVSVVKGEDRMPISIELDGSDHVITVEVPDKVQCTFAVNRNSLYAHVKLHRDSYKMVYTLCNRARND